MKVEGPVLLLQFDIYTGTISTKPNSSFNVLGTCAVGAIIILLSLLEPLSQGRVLHEGRETFVVGAVKIVLSL